MENTFSFFRQLDDGLLEKSGISVSDCAFSYRADGTTKPLLVEGKSRPRVIDDTDYWDIRRDGLCLEKTIEIEYPSFLYGPSGIAPSNAALGISIIWSNQTLGQRGFILPADHKSISHTISTKLVFSKQFAPGTIEGDLDIQVVMYLVDQSPDPAPDEIHLANEKGLKLGTIEDTYYQLSRDTMLFPINEINDPNEPLWWISFSQWDDPREDLFSEENVVLYLNAAYPECPVMSKDIGNLELLIQIISMSYLLILNEIKSPNFDNALEATVNDEGLQPNSICSIMHQFLISGSETIEASAPNELLLKSIQKTVSEMLRGGEDDEL